MPMNVNKQMERIGLSVFAMFFQLIYIILIFIKRFVNKSGIVETKQNKNKINKFTKSLYIRTTGSMWPEFIFLYIIMSKNTIFFM